MTYFSDSKTRCQVHVEIFSKTYNQAVYEQRIRLASYAIPAFATTLNVDGTSIPRAIGAATAVAGMLLVNVSLGIVAPLFKRSSFYKMTKDHIEGYQQAAVKSFAPTDLPSDIESESTKKWLRKNKGLINLLKNIDRHDEDKFRAEFKDKQVSIKSSCLLMLGVLVLAPAEIYASYKAGAYIGDRTARMRGEPMRSDQGQSHRIAVPKCKTMPYSR